jgi:hypothetical protein
MPNLSFSTPTNSFTNININATANDSNTVDIARVIERHMVRMLSR